MAHDAGVGFYARYTPRAPWGRMATSIYRANLVKMTKPRKRKPTHRRAAHKRSTRSDQWSLHDAKSRFSELVRRAKAHGPQHVTVHGREEVVVLGVEDYKRLQGEQTGAALIAALQASPHREIDLVPVGAPMPVRDVRF